jgi:hypothetical protein
LSARFNASSPRLTASASLSLSWSFLVSDMPQPIKNGLPPLYSPEAIDSRPELAVHIAKISAMWSEIETLVGLLLSHILGAHAEVGVAMYLALSGAASQRAALEGAATAQLKEPELIDVLALIEKISKRQKERNNIVHGMWGIHPDYPNDLILSDP